LVEELRPKEFILFELMNKAVAWKLNGMHLNGCDLEYKEDNRLQVVKEAAAEKNL
jgi:3-oxoisoapionate decarboxylase